MNFDEWWKRNGKGKPTGFDEDAAQAAWYACQEECAKVAEEMVKNDEKILVSGWSQNLGKSYKDACMDIAKAIREQL